MGLVRLCKGDLFIGHPEAIAHGCNLKGAMGAGIAIHFKDRFPEMYELYKEACDEKSIELGGVYIYDGEMNNSKVRVYNLMTQEGFDGADLNALRKALMTMCDDADAKGITQITMPLIGSGFGNVTPSTCLNLTIEAAFSHNVNLDVVVQVVDNQVPIPIFEKRPKIDFNRPIPVRQ